ncbi:MAG TPA: SRPBCC domain-containing protein [Allosphingosinicella sp.]
MPQRPAQALLLLVLAQALHSIEEYAFRLYDLLAPARYVSGLFGVDRPIGFVIVNSALVLFGLWCWHARVRPGRPSARALAWFWALLEIANGGAHVVLAVAAGGYFPGLATAPLLLGLGGLLAWRLSSGYPAAGSPGRARETVPAPAAAAPAIDWRIHFAAPPATVWRAWTSDAGRERFWAETSRRDDSGFDLAFVNGERLRVDVIEALAPERLVFRYFGGSTVTVEISADGAGGCDLRLREEDAPDPIGNHAGWVSVLLACKAAVDFGIDLRSRDPERSWDAGFVDV